VLQKKNKQKSEKKERGIHLPKEKNKNKKKNNKIVIKKRANRKTVKRFDFIMDLQGNLPIAR